MAEQNFSNHARTVPPYHLIAGPILLVNLVQTGIRLVSRFNTDTLIAFLVAVALVLLFWYARVFALTVQNRVIRLEMRLRLRDVLPPDLVARIPEFTVGQLVALRFAADDELPALARRVLDERLTDGKAIKRLVQRWQSDTLRA